MTQGLPRMGDREVDQQLVERAQRGDKRAFELLVMKYQRKLGRLLSRLVRDPAEVEDVTQEAFIKAYRALPELPRRQCVLHVVVSHRDQHGEELSGRDGSARADDDRLRQRGGRELRGCRAVAGREHAGRASSIGKQIAATVNRAMDALPEDLRTAITLREIEGLELRGNCQRDELSRSAPCARGSSARARRSPPSCGRCSAPMRTGDGDEREHISRLMDGELEDAEVERVARELKSGEARALGVLPRDRRLAARRAVLRPPGSPTRFAARLAAEPTVLAPQAVASRRPSLRRWPGRWRRRSPRSPSSAGRPFSMVDAPPTAIAKAREAGIGARGAGRSRSRCRRDYLLAHQEYSPATAIQGVGPYLRAVSAAAASDGRP